MIDDLYSAKLLRLAAETPRLGRLADAHASSEKVSKLCGSRVTVDVKVETPLFRNRRSFRAFRNGYEVSGQ